MNYSVSDKILLSFQRRRKIFSNFPLDIFAFEAIIKVLTTLNWRLRFYSILK